MIPYIVNKLAPNSSHLTKGLVKYVPGRSCFRAVSSENGDKFVTSTPRPQSLNGSLVFDVRRAVVSLPFQVHRLKDLVEVGRVAFSSAFFEFANKVPKEAHHGSLAHLQKFFSSHLHDLSKVAVVEFWA